MEQGTYLNLNMKGNIMGYALNVVKRYQDMVKAAQLALSNVGQDLSMPIMVPAGIGGDWNAKRPGRKMAAYRKKRRHKNQIARASRRANR